MPRMPPCGRADDADRDNAGVCAQWTCGGANGSAVRPADRAVRARADGVHRGCGGVRARGARARVRGHATRRDAAIGQVPSARRRAAAAG